MQLMIRSFFKFLPSPHPQLKTLGTGLDVGGDYLSDVEIDPDDSSKSRSSRKKKVISGESQSLLPALTVPDSELMVRFVFRPDIGLKLNLC